MHTPIQKAFIGGQWRRASKRPRISVINPFDQSELGTVPACGPTETKAAIKAATAAQVEWASTTTVDRAAILSKMAATLRDNADDLARLLTMEQGKPLAESKGEILYGAGYLEFYAAEALRQEGEIGESPLGQRITITREPIGACAAITPWNFPNAMLARKLAAALAAGCSMVAMPSPLTPFSALALAKAAECAGVPPGVFSVITGDPETIGPILTSSPLIRKLSFTGSIPIGKLLYKQSADTLKRLTLELGGNAPFVIFDDADLPNALDSVINAKFRNAGQTCICANRILIHHTIHDTFVECLASRIRALTCGAGLDPKTTIGPLINQKQANRVIALYDDAVAQGAREIIPKAPTGTTLIQPSLLTGITPGMRLWQEEIFGPIAAVRSFISEKEAIAMANDSNAGLAAYCFTSDASRSQRMSKALNAGIIGINSAAVSLPQAPFGGIKDSGFGREGSKHGLHEYQQLKYELRGL